MYAPRPPLTSTPSQRPMLKTDTSSASLKSPRTARFAEATSVDSPIDGGKPTDQAQWGGDADTPMTPIQHYEPQMQPSDIGFGYIHENDPNRRVQSVAMPAEDSSEEGVDVHTPLKSAMRTPGAPPRTPGFAALKSPTFKEEKILEKHEKALDIRQAGDVKVKFRVRVAKMLLRGVNFSCSLIVLSMLATTFTIFNATKNLPPRNKLPAWAAGTNPWPQIVLIVVSSISLLTCIIVFYGYWKGGHKRAEKVGVYYTIITVGSMIFAIVMWAVSLALLQNAQNTGNGQDLWGWSCKDNRRKSLFDKDVSYFLVCRLQNWSIICAIIEIVVELIAMVIYIVVFYRFHSKAQLRKSMDRRDKARETLYAARQKHGMNPLGDGSWDNEDPEKGYEFENAVKQDENNTNPGTKFTLQAAPLGRAGKGTPKIGSTITSTEVSPAPGEQTFGAVPIPQSYEEPHHAPVPAAPGEPQYGEVPLPGEYSHHTEMPAPGEYVPEHTQHTDTPVYDPNAEQHYYGRAM